jgi:hypothetical protein
MLQTIKISVHDNSISAEKRICEMQSFGSTDLRRQARHRHVVRRRDFLPLDSWRQNWRSSLCQIRPHVVRLEGVFLQATPRIRERSHNDAEKNDSTTATSSYFLQP